MLNHKDLTSGLEGAPLLAPYGSVRHQRPALTKYTRRDTKGSGTGLSRRSQTRMTAKRKSNPSAVLIQFKPSERLWKLSPSLQLLQIRYY